MSGIGVRIDELPITNNVTSAHAVPAIAGGNTAQINIAQVAEYVLASNDVNVPNFASQYITVRDNV